MVILSRLRIKYDFLKRCICFDFIQQDKLITKWYMQIKLQLKIVFSPTL